MANAFQTQKIKCGPGPANPGRIACGCLAALSPHHAVRHLSKPRSRRDARFWARSPSRDSADKVRVPWLAVIAQADGSILPVGRIFRGGRNARLSSKRAIRRVARRILRNPPAVHPREPPETPALLQSNSALKTSHICTGGTLLESQNVRNRNFMPSCAQAVEDKYSLWKAQEKKKEMPHQEIPPHKPECLR